MHILSILPNGVSAVDSLAEASMPAEPGFLWIICTNAEFGNRQQEIQAALHSLCGMQLVDLHISDLLNPYIPSHYDYTYQYDILVFRRLAASNAGKEKSPLPEADARRKTRTPILRKIGYGALILLGVVVVLLAWKAIPPLPDWSPGRAAST